jgi:hypothetical protein
MSLEPLMVIVAMLTAQQKDDRGQAVTMDL